LKDPTLHNIHRSQEQRSDSLDGATFSRIDQTPSLPPRPALTNSQITLDYLVHREIFRAIVANDEAALRTTWAKYPDVSIRAEEALSSCIKLSRFELIPVILDLGGSPEKLKSSHLETLLREERSDMLQILVEAGAPVNNEAGDSEALRHAVLELYLYIDRRTDENVRRALDKDHFHYHPEIGVFSFSTIIFLLHHGARMDTTIPEVQRSSKDSTEDSIPWEHSCYSALFSLFEKYGAALRTDHNFFDYAKSIEAMHPIEQAITRDDVAKVRELLSAKPGLLARVKNPLSKAILNNCSSKMLCCLIEHNCDVNEDFGKPLLYACIAYYRPDRLAEPVTVSVLLKNGADPNLRQAEAFINAFEKFPDLLGERFFKWSYLPTECAHYDTALRGLLKKFHLFPELGLVTAQERGEPAFKHVSMVKSLTDRGADPYSAILELFETPSLSPVRSDSNLELNRPSSHYVRWGEVLRESLKEQLSEEIRDLDDCYRYAHGSLFKHRSLMQLGNDSSERATITSIGIRYCHLMAQVLEPSNSCWINSLITGKQRRIPETTISPTLLRYDGRYKMVSDVAAIATVLHRPFVLRQKFIDLAKATFSERVKLKDSQESNESVFEWLPITKRLVKHFSDTALLPALFSLLRPEAVSYLTRPLLETVREDLAFLAAEALFDGRSLREIRDFTKRWYALADKHPIPISVYESWNAVLPQLISLPNGFVVKDVHSIKALREIGRSMNNCLVDGVHAPACFLGRARILAIFQEDVPIVAMTLETRDGCWHLTECEGPNHTKPDEGPDAPLTHFKRMLARNEISFNPPYGRSIRTPSEWDNETSDGLFFKYSNYLDKNRTYLFDPNNHSLLLALQAPGIDAAAFYRRWVVLNDKGSEKAVPLLRDEGIMKCNESLREMAEALSLFLEYSEKLYNNYPESAVKFR
jgi:hypothetical protein